jgi:sodium-independent sulfate anion transporter 11
MISLGATNIIGGFFASLPTSGSFARSAVNDASGVKSQFGGFFVGLLILLTLGVLTPTFKYIPKASLAAVIVCAVIFMVDFDAIILVWKASKIDFLCFTVTFLCSLFFGMEYGIGAGVGVSVLIILLKSMRPSLRIHLLTDRVTRVKYMLLKPDQGFYFPSVDYVRDSINKYARRYLNYPVIVIQCDKWTRWDYTAVNTMIGLSKSLEKSGRTLILYRNSQSWADAIHTFGVKKPLCCSHTTDLQESFNELKSKYYGIDNDLAQSRSTITQDLSRDNSLTDGNSPIPDNANETN